MSNIMYLTCRSHPTQSESLMIAHRHNNSSYSPRGESLSLAKFLETHARCGESFDHFTVSYAFPKDSERSPVTVGVKAALQVVK